MIDIDFFPKQYNVYLHSIIKKIFRKAFALQLFLNDSLGDVETFRKALHKLKWCEVEFFLFSYFVTQN